MLADSIAFLQVVIKSASVDVDLKKPPVCLFGWAELYQLMLYRFDDITTFSLLAQWRVLDCVLVTV